MRDFEKDFEFCSSDGVRVIKTQGCRIDNYKAVTHEPNRDNDTEHQARIIIYTERIQREMQELGITKGGLG
jgi:hypothetical protein